jgi:hypothetical protein
MLQLMAHHTEQGMLGGNQHHVSYHQWYAQRITLPHHAHAGLIFNTAYAGQEPFKQLKLPGLCLYH